MKAGNQTLLKKNNQRAIIDYIIAHGPISRADLSKKLKISKPTVSANMTELLNMKILQEIGYSETDVGKKPMLVDFNKTYRYVLALDFISFYAQNRISVSVCDLFCNPVFIDTIDLPPKFDANVIKHDVPKALLKLFEKFDVPLEKIAKVVLTAPTVWYDETHVTLECRSGEKVNLADVFKPYFKTKIAVKNDMNLAALGEKYFGVGKDCDNLAFFWIGHAVGGGVIINGELFEGKDLSAGELAYSIVYNEISGQNEFFRDITDKGGIERYVSQKSESVKTSVISESLLNNTCAVVDLIAAAVQGDAFCIEFCRHVAKITAVLISNFTNTMNLQMAIMAGEYCTLDKIFIEEIERAMKEIPLARVKITRPTHANSAMYGAFKFGTESIISRLI